MTRRRFVIISLSVLVAFLVGWLFWRWWQSYSAVQKQATEKIAEQQVNAITLASILGNPFEKIIFVGQNGTNNATYIAAINDGETAQLTESSNLIYSNFLPQSDVWYTVTDLTLQRQTSAGDKTTMANLTHPVTMADALGTQNSLAVDNAEQHIAWTSTVDNDIEAVRIYNLSTQQDTILFAGEPGIHYSNLTWSPDGTELGFTANAAHLITVTVAGAEMYNRITLPFSQMQYVTWLDRDHFGCVVTSLSTNPNPFQPKIIIFDRNGTITEEHSVLNKVGVPKVIWSADGKEFLFHDPWRNTFLIYDRYNQLQLTLAVNAPGKLLPLGWTSGETFRAPEIHFGDDLNTNSTTTPTKPEDFDVSAEAWDHYNNLVRSILEQFKIDFSTYRFAATAAGFEIRWTFSPEQPQAEMIILQTMLQIFAVIPGVPSITIQATLPDGRTVISLTNITPDQAEGLTQQFTGKSVEELFVINKNNTIGKRAVKSEQSDHHYIGDLVYSNFGDYNPYPALATLEATVAEQQFYHNATVSWLYPTQWQMRELDTITTLLFMNETEFISPTAWSNFGVTIKRYQAPNVTFNQWLEVNRRDQIVESVDWTVHRPLEVRHIQTDTTYSDEYILYANNNVYVIHIERDAGVTDEDTLIMQKIIQSFTDAYAFQRN